MIYKIQNVIKSDHDEYLKGQDKLKEIENSLEKLEKIEYFKDEIKEKVEILLKTPDFQSKFQFKETELQNLIKQKENLLNIIKIHDEKVLKLDEFKAIKNELMNKKRLYLESCVCGFDHRCESNCSLCSDTVSCKLPSGHESIHICEKDSHTCRDRCGKPGCSNLCIYEYGHQCPHECKSRHECNQECKYCSNSCKFFSYQNHQTHMCKSEVCSKTCILCSKPCASKKHNHDEETEEVENPFTKSRVKLHLCGEIHKCKAKCQQEGACSVLISSQTQLYKTDFGEIAYEYLKTEVKENKCSLHFEAGKLYHEGVCRCKVDSHRCKETCPCCNQFCMYEFGHQGRHNSKNHRNMEYCIFTSSEKDAKVSVNEKGQEVREYKVGDSATPERCQESCVRKGRGHYHLKECPGGEECAEKKYPRLALHSDGIFEPFPSKKFDKIICNMFWASFNWELPFSDSALNTEISLCNFYCPKNHPENQFCSKEIWHSLSQRVEDHQFKCETEHKQDGVDVCFLLDTTGSMSMAINNSKKAIQRIMEETKREQTKGLKIRFSVVSYKDHCDGDKVVQSIDFTEANKALDFLEIQTATGGGDGPEAVVDGLDKVSVQSWSNTSIKFLVHILDAPPHGTEFGYSNDDYPKDCPCCKDYNDVLKKIKKIDIRYYIVKLNSSVNKMVEIFKTKVNITEIPICGSLNYTEQVANLICEASKDLEMTVLKTK